MFTPATKITLTGTYVLKGLKDGDPPTLIYTYAWMEMSESTTGAVEGCGILNDGTTFFRLRGSVVGGSRRTIIYQFVAGQLPCISTLVRDETAATHHQFKLKGSWKFVALEDLGQAELETFVREQKWLKEVAQSGVADLLREANSLVTVKGTAKEMGSGYEEMVRVPAVSPMSRRVKAVEEQLEKQAEQLRKQAEKLEKLEKRQAAAAPKISVPSFQTTPTPSFTPFTPQQSSQLPPPAFPAPNFFNNPTPAPAPALAPQPTPSFKFNFNKTPFQPQPEPTMFNNNKPFTQPPPAFKQQVAFDFAVGETVRAQRKSKRGRQVVEDAVVNGVHRGGGFTPTTYDITFKRTGQKKHAVTASQLQRVAKF